MKENRLLEVSTRIKENSTKTEIINDVLSSNNVTMKINSIDELELNKSKDLSTIRISSEYYQTFNNIKTDLKARGISISTQEFFDYVISHFFKKPV